MLKIASVYGQRILTNPLDLLLDILIRAVLALFIPFPLASELVMQFRGLILLLILNGVVFFSVLFFIAVGFFSTASVMSAVNTRSIALPIDGSFISTDTPLQNPLGGAGLTLVSITAGFMDPHYSFFGGRHTGIDFVPNQTYYQTNSLFKKTGDVIVYATMNGTSRFYIDQYGSHSVEIVNSANTIKTIAMHLNKVFLSSNSSVVAGQPIGTMGNTGFTTGGHLHYEIRIMTSGIWTPVNPLSYIN